MCHQSTSLLLVAICTTLQHCCQSHPWLLFVADTSTLLTPHQHDLIPEFFGGRVEHLYQDNAAPPPYTPTTNVEKLPPYEAKSPLDKTPMTKYMFIIPLFWIMGFIILHSPLQLTPDWHPEKPEEERREMMEKMREVEMAWARRCLWALVTLISVILVIVLAVVIAKFA
ncbi:hypothetical protein JAAARDRAFT_198294 [Jaapia argillacea MUCL 33604]|uniref:Transmembrane protein n=1 Tax=Jaapia argillacea MUCL 33604 TaxID=933084 RepID=A0A067PPX8_9AGAM|nr:hypothetical protein JAAARDRAFT_198294 [Jaapia argillacea MUCL 33604]